jgi:hypothetical protein
MGRGLLTRPFIWPKVSTNEKYQMQSCQKHFDNGDLRSRVAQVGDLAPSKPSKE